MGKSTALKHLAVCWANGSVKELKQFDFVFHVSLKDVHKNDSIESIIITQHKGLSGNNVQPHEIKRIMEDTTKQVVLLLDGHDEYKRGINVNIDRAITKDLLRNCCIVLTSRESKELSDVRECMDVEAEIKGFDEQGREEYITKYLGSTEKTSELLTSLKHTLQVDCRVHEILRIPFLLHMICVLFNRSASLPKTKTGVLDAIVDRCINWDAIRKCGKKKLEDMKDALIKLGKLAMEGLQRDQFQQTFTEVQSTPLNSNEKYREFLCYLSTDQNCCKLTTWSAVV